jgi:hypothetical protein
MDRMGPVTPAGEEPGETAVSATGSAASPDDRGDPSPLTFDRHLVLEQLGGWRGMVDASLPTIAFIAANALAGLRTGIWAALVCALLVFVLRLVRRESIQQAFSGLFAVGIAVAIAAFTGRARDFYVPGIIRNAGLALVLLGSVLVRRPLVGVVAEFLAPSHLGAMAAHRHSVPGMRGRLSRARAVLHPTERNPDTGRATPDPEPELPWREDRRLLRAYGWLTVLWGGVFLVRAAVQGYLYLRNDGGDATDLGVVSLLLGLPISAVVIVVTLWVVSRLHRHRVATAGEPEQSPPA